MLKDIILEALGQQDLDMMKSLLIDSGMSEEEASQEIMRLSGGMSQEEPSEAPVNGLEGALELPEVSENVTEEESELDSAMAEIGEEGVNTEAVSSSKTGLAVLNKAKEKFTKELRGYKTVSGAIEDYTSPNNVYTKDMSTFELYILFLANEIEKFRKNTKAELEKLPKERCTYEEAALLRNTPLSDFVSGDSLVSQLKISLIRGYIYYFLTLSVYTDLSPRGHEEVFYQPQYKSAIGARLKALDKLVNIDPEGPWNLWYKRTTRDLLNYFKQLFGEESINYIFARNDNLTKWYKRTIPNLESKRTEITALLLEAEKKQIINKKLRPLNFDALTRKREEDAKAAADKMREQENISSNNSNKTTSLSDAILDILLERFIPVVIKTYTFLTNEALKKEIDTIDQDIFRKFSSPDIITKMALKRVNKIRYGEEKTHSAEDIRTLDSGNSESAPGDIESLSRVSKEQSENPDFGIEEKQKGLAELLETIGGNDMFKYVGNGNVLVLLSDLIEKRWKKNNTYLISVVNKDNVVSPTELFSWLETQEIKDENEELTILRTIFDSSSLTTSKAKFLEYFIPEFNSNSTGEQLKTTVESFNRMLNNYKCSGFVPTNLTADTVNSLVQQFNLNFEKVATNNAAKLQLSKEEPKTFKELILDNLSTRNIGPSSEQYTDLLSAKSNAAFYLIACSIFSAKVINTKFLPNSSDKDLYIKAAKEIYPSLIQLINSLIKNKTFGNGTAYKGLTINELLVFFALASEPELKSFALDYDMNAGSNGFAIRNKIEKIPTLLKESKQVPERTEIQHILREKVYSIISNEMSSPSFGETMIKELKNFSTFIFAFGYNPVDFYTPAELKGTSKDFKGGDLKGILLDGVLNPRQRRFILPKLFSFLDNPTETNKQAQKFFVEKFSSFKQWLFEQLNLEYEKAITKEDKLKLKPMLVDFFSAIEKFELDDNILLLKEALLKYSFLFKDPVHHQFYTTVPIRFHNVYDGIISGRLTSLRQEEQQQEETPAAAQLSPVTIKKKFTL